MATAIIVGNLGRDAELRYLQNGTPLLEINIADSVYHRGERKTQWVRCSWFGDRAEKMAGNLVKGQRVVVFGSDLFADTYQGKEGDTRLSVEMRVDRIEFAGKKED